jgi:ornithine cyclodeaminase/alanine dehydrogenase-like protein (mu-crystallin family)
MFVLSAADLRAVLPMAEAIAAMKRAFAALSDGRAEVPLRTRLRVPGAGGESLFMPAFLADPAYEALTVKIVSVFPRNVDKTSLRSVHSPTSIPVKSPFLTSASTPIHDWRYRAKQE